VRSARGDAVRFNGEFQDGKDASVETRVVRRYSDDLPIDYWLHNVNGQWKVFNMVIDHVDIAKNVNAQFERVIARSSFRSCCKRSKIRTHIAWVENISAGTKIPLFIQDRLLGVCLSHNKADPYHRVARQNSHVSDDRRESIQRNGEAQE